ncbi:MAG: DUF2062 domain-containing protein [Calothrix sp. SM1_5_4]|nr:DUF2062 domain-containing protein [Calothrix sp. SM1_5_4]
MIWAGIAVREVEVDVVYPPAGERVSHFHKFWDNLRISLLNTALVAMSLLKTHKDPFHLGLAAGLGVFVGCTPLFGFHSLIAAALAFVFRLNFLALWVGTQISLPPFIPLLALGSVTAGKNWLRLDDGLPAYLAGSLVLGAALGLAAGLLTFVAARTIQSGKGARGNWSGRTRGGRFGNGFLKLVLRRLGLRAGIFVCG